MIDGNLAGSPKYIIECCVPMRPNMLATGRDIKLPVSIYRIVVHAQGYNARTQVTLESRFTASFK